jgi:hypothetical protein
MEIGWTDVGSGGYILVILVIVYLRFIITLVKGVFDLQIDKKKETKINMAYIVQPFPLLKQFSGIKMQLMSI